MQETYVQSGIFDKTDFSLNPLAKGEYDSCKFLNCNFAEADLSAQLFSACEFVGCNLSMVKLRKTAWREIKFRDSKILGVQFEHCNDIGMSLQVDSCILNHTSFYGRKLKGTLFRNSSLQEVDFTACDLTRSCFDNCDLTRATFENTILEQVDFRTSYNYSIDPERNKLRKARFSSSGIIGLLDKYDIVVE